MLQNFIKNIFQSWLRNLQTYFEVGRLDTYFKVGRLEYIYQRLIKLELCVISWHLPAVYTGLVYTTNKMVFFN